MGFGCHLMSNFQQLFFQSFYTLVLNDDNSGLTVEPASNVDKDLSAGFFYNPKITIIYIVFRFWIYRNVSSAINNDRVRRMIFKPYL